MRLAPISEASSRPFLFQCCQCRRNVWTDRDPEARADLDGESFRHYLCGDCATGTAKMVPASLNGDDWNVLRYGHVVLERESYMVASQVVAALNGQPGAAGEAREVADSIRAAQEPAP